MQVTAVPSFISDFNLLNCEWDNFTFKKVYWVISHIKLKQNKRSILLQIL